MITNGALNDLRILMILTILLITNPIMSNLKNMYGVDVDSNG